VQTGNTRENEKGRETNKFYYIK